MKQKTSFVIVYWWLLLLLVCGMALLGFAEKEERLSESENRLLSGFPEFSLESLASGEFFLGIESYLSDGVWGRDRIVGISESVLGIFSAATADEENLLKDAAMADEIQGVDPLAEAENAGTAEDAPAPEAEEAPEVLSGSDAEAPVATSSTARSVEELEGYGMWRIRQNGTYEQLVEARDKDLQKVASALNGYKQVLPEDGQVFYTNVPMTGRALSTRDSCTGWYENIPEGLAQYTVEGVHMVSTVALLEAPLWAGEHLYFASDHHWTPRAAIRIVNECIRVLGLPLVPYEEYAYSVGTFSNATEHTVDDLELMHPLQEVSGTYLDKGDSCELINYQCPTYRAYLNGDSKVWTRYVSGFATGRSCLVIGDSFSNAATPYLMPYYDNVYKVDARYYDPEKNGGTMAELIRKYEIDDVYIIVSQNNGITSATSQTKLERALNGK